MVFIMKQSIKDLRIEMDAKEEELQKIKKLIRYSKI
jgi:hypothetical protein